jgi:3-oxoacyl-[acyl-carrier protein] reductase
MATKQATSKIALVTGVAGGMGLAIARALIADGFSIVGTDRHAPADQSIPMAWYPCELSDRAAVEAMAKQILADGHAVDVLVNCAGLNQQKPGGGRNTMEEVTDAIWDLTLAVNLTAPFVLCRAFAPGMKQRKWGRIVNIASRAGRTFVPASNVDYSASKAGLIGLTRMIAGECSAFGITANCVAPGRISTPLADGQSAEIIAESLRGIPAARVGTVEEIAGTVAFLASDASAYITGTTIDVNGGAFM